MARYNQVGSHKTTVSYDSETDMQSCVYHSTPVVEWDSEKIVLNSGGWHSNTTKLRMNQVSNQYGLDYGVFQKDYAWYVDYKGETLDFTDNMVLSRQ